MGRLPGWLVVAAVGALVALAAADAIRPDGDQRAPVASSSSSLQELKGVFVFADERCVPQAVRLPSLAAEEARLEPDCGGRVFSFDGSLVASCRGGSTSVTSPDGQIAFGEVRGCAPAWRIDGALAVIRDGDLVLWRRRGPERLLFAQDQLARKLGTLVQRPETYVFSEVRWLDVATLVAIIRGGLPWETAAAVFQTGRLTALVPQFGGHIAGLRASPRGGSFAFARTDPGREYVLVDRSGEEIRLPRIANAHAIAWSPDETWVAVATRTATFLARTGTRRVLLRISRGGDSLAWLR